jgi:hypothetical protein
VGRVLQHLGDRADLHEAPAVEHRDSVRDPRQRAQVVGDDDHGQTELVTELVEQPQHEVAVGYVERADRLVAEQQTGPGDDGPRQRDSLPLST